MAFMRTTVVHNANCRRRDALQPGSVEVDRKKDRMAMLYVVGSDTLPIRLGFANHLSYGGRGEIPAKG
jgi:hypothetical protein